MQFDEPDAGAAVSLALLGDLDCSCWEEKEYQVVKGKVSYVETEKGALGQQGEGFESAVFW